MEANQTQATSQPASEAQPAGSPAASPPGAPAVATPPGAPAVATPPGTPAATTPQTVSAALAASPRVIVDTPSIGGSIALKGGKIDDIILKDYPETIDAKSPNIRLFSPPRTPDAYSAETGFVGPAGAQDSNFDTVWTADRQTLHSRPAGDIDLGQWRGPCFQAGDRGRRQTHVHDRQYGRELRRRAGDGRSPTGSSCATAGRTCAGYSVLHEGFVGVITGGGASGVRLTLPVQEVTYAAIEKDAGRLPRLQGRRRLARVYRQVLGLRSYSR